MRQRKQVGLKFCFNVWYSGWKKMCDCLAYIVVACGKIYWIWVWKRESWEFAEDSKKGENLVHLEAGTYKFHKNLNEICLFFPCWVSDLVSPLVGWTGFLMVYLASEFRRCYQLYIIAILGYPIKLVWWPAKYPSVLCFASWIWSKINQALSGIVHNVNS